MPHKPLVISHRGANRLAPENTLIAFAMALKLGVDGFENDCHMTRDGHVVVLHDDTVDRTSDGAGLVCEKTLEELRALDFGGWFSPAFEGTRIPTLEEWFGLCKGLKVINVELKAAPGGSTASAPATIAIAKRAGLFNRLIISSFDMEMLEACKAADPTTRTCLLFSPITPITEDVVDDPAGFARTHDIYAYHPFVGMVTEDFVEECHDAGIVVNPWVVNQVHNLEALRKWGCDAVITDEPALAVGLYAAPV